MKNARRGIVVAGHICLDIIPSFAEGAGDLQSVLIPGKLNHVGPAVIATGGAVSNAGQALHGLGLPVRLAGKVGQDPFGNVILDKLRERDPALADHMIVDPAAASSYTVVLSPPGIDRVFLHCPGANDTFGTEDLDPALLTDARLVHFGYPPLMERMYRDGGCELARLLDHIRQAGAVVSLDMALPDPDSAAGHADWPTILRRALPHVDVFLPSLDEIQFMLGIPADRSGPLAAQCRAVAEICLDLGTGLVVLKLGDGGLYLRTADAESFSPPLAALLPETDSKWEARELYTPCFATRAVGTNGAGDCTIAGFLAALLHELPPEEALQTAVAVGACSVEAVDATSGVQSWAQTLERIEKGWKQLPPAAGFEQWPEDRRTGVRTAQ